MCGCYFAAILLPGKILNIKADDYCMLFGVLLLLWSLFFWEISPKQITPEQYVSLYELSEKNESVKKAMIAALEDGEITTSEHKGYSSLW